MRRQKLHLIDVSGDPVSPTIKVAVEAAFNWAVNEFPHIDQAIVANAAESLAKSMEIDKDSLNSARRYAYAAMRGRVLDWLRKNRARELSVGLDRELDQYAEVTHSFQQRVDRTILFEQLRATLSERDRDILVLLLSGASSANMAVALGVSSKAARKAVQRVRERISVCVQAANAREKSSLHIPSAKDLAKEWT